MVKALIMLCVVGTGLVRWSGFSSYFILLAMAGAEIPAAVIVAAKGVVRFPEISKPGGRAAEVFLIGSMTSWTLAVLGIALLRAL